MQANKLNARKIISGFCYGLLMFGFLFSANSFAKFANMPLAPDRAFVFSASVKTSNEILAEWKIAPGYYLYAKRLHITLTPDVAKNIHLPKGEMKTDPTHKIHEVYSGNLTIPVQLQTQDQSVKLRVQYQGCAQEGFCYPPMEQTLTLNLADKSVTQQPGTPAPFQSLITNQNDVVSLFHTQNIPVLLLLFAGLGLLLAFTPCVLPMIPILTGIILGQKHKVGTREAFFLSLTYVLGMAITYACAGLIAASLGSSVQVWLQQPIMIFVVSMLFVFLGLSLFGFYDLKISHRWQNKVFAWSDKHEGGTYAGVFFMGILSTLVVSPCVTAPLVGVLIFIGDTGNRLLGASALFVMGLGMGAPLLLIGMSAGKWLPKSGPWMKTVKATFGILMLAMAVWLLSRIVSPMMAQTLWGVWVVGVALFFGFYVPHHMGQYRFNRGLGIVIGAFGVMVMLGGVGVSTVLDRWIDGPAVTQKNAHLFTVVRNVEDIDKQLALAKAQHRPVMLDFYADWCASCVAMERHVFSTQVVKQALENFILLRADLTANSSADQEIMKHYNVVAPPTMLFFNNMGQEVNSKRMIGEMSANEFLSRVEVFMAASCDKKVQC